MGVSYIICAAGRGTRTQEISKVRPKPLLRIEGKTLLRRSIESLPIREQDQVLVLYSSNIDRTLLEEELHRCENILASNCRTNLMPVLTETRGQLETAFLAKEQIPIENSVCVFNSDTQFNGQDLELEKLQELWDGLIPCAQVDGESWSFCRVKDDTAKTPLILEVTEKRKISSWCSVGFYWFRSCDLFFSYASKEMRRFNGEGEMYVAPLYNQLIKNSYKIGMPKVAEFRPMGSVEQIKKFWGLGLEEMRNDNL